MDSLRLLLNRNSSPRLTEPAPSASELETLFAAALRVPDHAWLCPWRFLLIRGEGLQRLGELFADAAEQRDGPLEPGARDKYLRQPLRAPLMVVVCANIQDHPKVPDIEQQLSAGCAAHALLLAAEALGYAGVWRTGVNAYDTTVQRGLGLTDKQRIVGFLYLGTRQGEAKALPSRAMADFVSEWEGPV